MLHRRSIFIFLWVSLFLLEGGFRVTALSSGSDEVIKSGVEREYNSLFALYRYLHANPELSRQEIRTAARIATELTSAGFRVTTDFGGHGVVGVLGNGNGPTILIRTDMDALPVVEETGLSYASRVRTRDAQGREVGVMHACGHDMHMTCFTGTARLLAQMKDAWHGTLVMVAQPAEELAGGARGMLQAGLYREFPRPDYALALHNDAELESGKIGICEGNVLAGVDSIDLTVRGVSGHGAFPAYTKDPIVLSAQIILALQTIVSRELRSTEPAVVTVGSIHGGTKHNIIPGEVQLQLTVRQYSDEVRNHILKSIDRIARGVALAAGVPEDRAPVMKVYEEENLPPTYNQPELARRTAKAIAAILGEERVVKRDPVMGAEDFAFFGRTEEKVPITLFWLGTVSPEKLEESRRSGLRLPSLHSSVFAPVPETTIRTGVTAMTAAALDLFR